MKKYFVAIAEPVSADAPCGIDPEADPEILNFLTTAEGQLPASFIKFSKKDFDATGQIKQITALLTRCRDIRLLVLAAKTFILNDDIAGFSDSLRAISALVREHWDHFYPLAPDQDVSLRTAYLKSLDDLPTVILPFHNAPLAKDRRMGSLTFRAHLVATKQLPARKDEQVQDPATIRDAFLKCEDLEAIKTVYSDIVASGNALKDIRSQFVEKAGYENAPSFEQLPALLTNIEDYLKSIIEEREPSATIVEAELPVAPEENTEPAKGEEPISTSKAPLQAMGSLYEAAKALEAIEAYFTANEPSSPSRLLVRQAHQLVGKTFVEAMEILAPDLVSQTSIKIRGDSPFALSFDQLRTLAASESNVAPAETTAQNFSVQSRLDATRLMSVVEAYYRKSEPSSPIPLLVEKARLFVDKDFSSLLKEMIRKPEE